MSRVLLPVLALLVGCAPPDQGFWPKSQVSPGMLADMARLDFLDPIEDVPPSWTRDHLDFPGDPGWAEELEDDPPEIAMSLEAVLQRTRWGESLARCQIEVGFRDVGDDDDSSQGSDLSVLVIPDATGTCAYTALRPEEIEDPVGFGTGEDDWELSGTLSGADTIYLHSETTTLTLHRQEIGAGQVRYEVPSCSIADFPFGQVFDLEVPSLEGAAIPGFYVEEALAVGPDLRFREPVVSLSADILYHRADSPIYGVWDDLGPPPVVLGEALEPDRMIFVRNHTEGSRAPFEALACLPPDRQMAVGPEALALLEANPDRVTEAYYIAFQVDTVFNTPAFEAPWGQTVYARSTVSESGEVHLYEAD